MAKMIQWYLCCIRSCQLEMTGARKPFNPVLGETFKCLYHVKDGEATDRYIKLTSSDNCY